jgi:hypothetical protein
VIIGNPTSLRPTTPSATPVELTWVRADGPRLRCPTDDVRGMVVVDPSGYRIGDVVDLAIDAHEQRARLLAVVSGGLLGLCVSERLLPVDAVCRVDDRVHLDRNHGDVYALPAHEHPATGAACGSARPDLSNVAAIYQHFGVVAFWNTDRAARSYFHSRGDDPPSGPDLPRS